MRNKKKEKDKSTLEGHENNEADLEKFLQTFEKPTRIYRYLRTRHLVSVHKPTFIILQVFIRLFGGHTVAPLFLQRTLYYMKHRRSVSNALRKTFKVDSLLEKKTATSGEGVDNKCSGCKYLRLDLQGFYDEQIPPDIQEVEVEAILTRIQQSRKSDKDSLNINHTSLGKVKIPVNPNWNQSSLDGTQCSRSSSPCPATIISSEGFTFKPTDCSQSYSLHLSVTCHLSQSLSNGISTMEGGHSGSQPKRHKGSSVRSRSASLEDNVVVYGTELRVFGKQYQCMLKTGRYDLILQEVGSKFSTQDCLWEKAAGKRPIDALEVFDTCPTLKFYLCWTDDPEGLKPCVTPPSEFIRNNQYLKKVSACDLDSSASAKEEGQGTPEKKVQVAYQFLYNENTRQQTDTRDNMHCPWCSLNCEKIYSLLKHLRLSHARFNIIYSPTPSGHRIDVSLNDCFDGAYAGNPQDLNSHIGFAYHRLGPVRRTSVTHVLVYRPKRPVPSLQEFFEPEKENQVSRLIIQGHNRLYYRTKTCMPLKPQEINQDSEDEITPQWLCQKSVNLIDEFTDVNEGEKELMKMWNLHCMKYAYISDCQIPQACQTFVEEHGREIIMKDLIKNFSIHLVNMFDFSLITPDIVQRTMWQLYTVRDDLEMSGQLTCSS